VEDPRTPEPELTGRARRLAACVLVLVVLAAAEVRAETLQSLFRGPATRAIGNALADTVARSLPLTSASRGIVFHFDPETGAFEREADIFGQLFLERARPIGDKKWSVTFDYQWVQIDSFNGQNLSKLRDVRTGIQTQPPHQPFVVPDLSIGVTSHQFTTQFTYGLGENLELNLAVPLLYTEASVDGRLFDFAVQEPQQLDRSESAFGFGDIFLRGKYRVVAGRYGDVAGGLVLRMPAGRQANFQGTGDWEVGPRLYASTRPLPIQGSPFEVEGYLNGGIDFNADDVADSQGQVGVGIDLILPQWASIGVAFLLREPFESFAPPGTFDRTRVNRTTGNILRQKQPIFGFSRARPSYQDLSVGGRFNVWRDTVFLVIDVRVPINDDGFRSDVIPLFGVEATF
jgi:hypothetical protein